MTKDVRWKIICIILLGILILSNIYFIKRIIKAENELNILNSEYESELELKEWENLVVKDYISLIEKCETVNNSLLTYIARDLGLENAQLIAEASIHMNNGTKELYLIRHKDCDNEFVMTYTGVLVDCSANTSAILFQTKDAHDILSFEEYYDMKICDIDGNGEEDIILLLGAHRSVGKDAFLPDIYCMLGLQEAGEFCFISNYDEKWLEEITNELYNGQSSNRNIDNIFNELQTYYKSSEAPVENIEKLDIRDYICNKDNMISKKIDDRSLYSERELLWETFEVNDNGNIQSIKYIKKLVSEDAMRINKSLSIFLII